MWEPGWGKKRRAMMRKGNMLLPMVALVGKPSHNNNNNKNKMED